MLSLVTTIAPERLVVNTSISALFELPQHSEVPMGVSVVIHIVTISWAVSGVHSGIM